MESKKIENFARPNRPALRYHGGKWRLAPWIIKNFPPHICYVEPYGGGASVLLRKPPSSIEVYNDLSSDVVNFFMVLRKWPAELISAIDLTPYSREEFKLAQERVDDPLERARRFFVWSWQGRGRGGVNEPGGWRFMSRQTRTQTPVQDWNSIEHLWAVVRRLKEVHLENDDACAVINRFDDADTFFYVDPPYVQSTRCRRWKRDGYQHDMTDQDHCEMSAVLHSIRGMAIVSGYPSALYAELFQDWTIIQRRASRDNGNKIAIECLWVSPKTLARAEQLKMF